MHVLTKMKEQTVMTISFSNTHSLRIKPLLVGIIAPFKTTNPARIRKCKMFMPHYQSAKSLTIPHFQPNFQIHGPVQIWKSKNSKCYYLLNYSVFVSALHMNMICVDGSKVLASKEDCLIITAISSLFEPRTV